MRSQVILQEDCNAPVTIMKAILDISKEVVYQCFVIYINYIIIYFKKYEEHVRHLKQVLQLLEEEKFYLKDSTC